MKKCMTDLPGMQVTEIPRFALFKGESEIIAYELSSKQYGILLRTLYAPKETDSTDALMYDDDELLRPVDTTLLEDGLLSSIPLTADMLEASRYHGAALLVSTGTGRGIAIPLSMIQAATVVARLGLKIPDSHTGTGDDGNRPVFPPRYPPWMHERPKKTEGTETGKNKHRYSMKNITAGICRPDKIKAELDKCIIGQNHAKEKLATAVYEQEIRRRYADLCTGDSSYVPLQRKNLLIYGPSGCGKTAMIKKLAEIVDKPVIIFDSTSLTPAGYTGCSVSNILQELLKKAGGDISRASHGIIYIDEWDKAFIGASGSREVSTFKSTAAAFELLRMLDGCEVPVETRFGTETLSTDNILFILGGAFPNLDQIVRQRIDGSRTRKRPLGFCTGTVTVPKKDHLTEPDLTATLEDLRAYGIPTEALGRISTICRLQPLDKMDLVRIFALSESSPLKQYQTLFSLHKVKLVVPSASIQTVADMALEQKLGARGLVTILEQVLSPLLFQLAGNRTTITVTVRPECFTDGCGPEITKRRSRRVG